MVIQLMTAMAFRKKLYDFREGDEITLTVVREQQTLDLKTTIQPADVEIS